MNYEKPAEYALGLDLGSNSLGWAIVGLVDGEPAKFIRCGVRIFPAGIVNEKGTEKSPNLGRRLARLHRRQLWRRRRRLKKTFHLLQRFDLLPSGPSATADVRQEILKTLDQRILDSGWFQAMECTCSKQEQHVLRQKLPYLLRATAMDGPLQPHFLGRALYHLAQRRGFLSNSKRIVRKDEKPGQVKEGIETLRGKLRGRTLGQYLATLSPFESKVRRIWTARDMYQDEFERIWTSQMRFQPDLFVEERKSALYHAIFNQRGPKEKPGSIGKCEFEPTEPRAHKYLLSAQRFRMLQAVNDLRVSLRGAGEQARPLSVEHRAKLIQALDRKGDLTFKVIREILGLSPRHSFNLQRENKDASMPGDNTGSQFYCIFGDRWFALHPEERDRIVADAYSIRSVRDERDWKRRAEKYLSNRAIQDLDAAIESFKKLEFEDGRMGLSVKAMKRFLPLMECGYQLGDLQAHYPELESATPRLTNLVKSGTPREEALRQVLTRQPKREKLRELLPPLQDDSVQHYLGQVRNPVVLRSLTELRRVTNAVIRQYGKPAFIRVELARELKNSKEERERIWRDNNARERSNTQMIEEIKRETGAYSPGDLTRYKLWRETKDGTCPYCLQAMSRPSLFADATLQVDHIIPRGRLLDDSFTNLALCHAECNQKKGDRTPFEAFSSTERWREILVHAKSLGDAKLRRFKMTAVPGKP